jgi:hypothetical protein
MLRMQIAAAGMPQTGPVDLGDIGSVGSAAIALLALLVAIVGQRKADAAVDHARRSADAAERMATALEDRAVERERLSEAPGVVWRLEHFQGDSYVLTNAGRAPAYEVHVDTGDIPIVRGTERDQAVIEADGFLKFMAARSMGTKDDTITVTWADEQGSSRRHRWARPLPPKPPRRH